MKILFLATNSYPYGKGEPLLAFQMERLAKDFDKIVIVSTDLHPDLSYELKENVEVIRFSPRLSGVEKLVGVLRTFSPIIVEEVKNIIQNYEIKFSYKQFKVLINSFSIARKYKKLYDSIIQERGWEGEQLCFHSYWCTEAVLGYSLLREKFPDALMVSRFHAYDLYFERHSPEYLPFRKFIFEKLNKLFFISEQGKEYFKCLFKDLNYDHKLVVNRLGVDKLYEIKEHKNQLVDGICIVSCSSLIELKRIDLMIEAFSKVEGVSLKWIHFGEGPLKEMLAEKADLKLKNKSNVSYTFYGFIENHDLLKFYSENKVDLFINTSKYEGVPISIMEAMCYGIPCIATDVGGVSEIINPSNGLLLPVDFSTSELAAYIVNHGQKAIEDRAKMSQSAHSTWETKYNGEKNYKALVEQMKHEFKSCSRCLYDTKDYPEIKFDKEGVCEICHIYDDLQERTVFKNEEGELKLTNLLNQIKTAGRGKKYDCIIGVSGGVDSSYLAYLSKQWGLKPLIMHVDNGWNSELATKNIESILKVLNYDLYTEVINWDEMKDMQLAFLKASVVDIDLPFDNAFMAILFKIAKKYKIKYILSGHNTVTEGWMPPNFTHYKLDTINLKAIHKKFGTVRLKTFQMIGPLGRWVNSKLYKIQFASPLDYVSYNKAEVKKILINDLNWKDYGGKHYENNFTKFYQGYILPNKFRIDKRKSHLSTLICSNQVTKEEAQLELLKPIYNPDEVEQDKEYFVKKIGLSMDEFEKIMQEPVKKHTDFPSYINLINRLRNIKNLLKR